MATDFNNTEDYEKLAFDEEAEALECVEGQIDGILAPLQEKIAKLDRDLRNWRAVDYDDIARKKIAIDERERAIEREEATRSYKAEPYFCHFEAVVDDGEARSFYIGEKGIGNFGQTIVLDWRSPLGKTYRNKSQRQFKTDVEDGKYVHTYDLKLRRMVQIKDAKLLGVNTEFDTADMSLDGEIIDPFLLSVLKDKRRNYKLSDIIKTIQQSQNEILELPIDENFIVQGCAGSGKTMILLHRLSYLAFNHPKTDFSKYVVLTPSQSFNEHIDELCEQLELGSISRMTVESYYVRLGRQLSRNDTYVKGGGKGSRKTLPKVAFEDLRIVPELQLPPAYLERVYSVTFSAQLSDVVAGFRKAALSEVEDSGVASMLEAKGEGLSGNASVYDLYLGLRRSCRKIRSEVDIALARVSEKRGALEGAAAELEKVSSGYESAVNTLGPIAASVREQAIPSFRALEEGLEGARRNLKNAQSRFKIAEQHRQKTHDSLSEAQDALDELNGELDEARKAAEGSIGIDEVKGKPEVQAAASEACAAESEAIVALERELSDTGVFGFGKKRRLREGIRRAEEAYRQAYEAALDEAAGDHIRTLRETCEETLVRVRGEMSAAAQQRDDLAVALLESQERCKGIEDEIESLEAAVVEAKAPVDALKPFVDAFASDDYPDASKLPGADEVQAWSEELAAYSRTYQELSLDQRRYLKRGEDRVRILAENLETAKRDLSEAEGMVVTEEDMRLLDAAETIAEGLDAKAVKQAFYEEIDSLRKEHGVGSADPANYRHDLYMRLLFCHLYYGSVDGAGVCVSIDEAQDLSKAELALLKGILGPEAVINLYGDTGQMIYPHRGISDWAEAGRMISAGVYTLDENYRNTLQITDYCNQRLGLKTVGVGLDGAEVVETGLRDAVEELFALRASRDGLRCAIVYRRGLAGVKGTLDELLGKDASYGVVDSGKVSVIPVEVAKGLEFDAVVVIEDGMSDNELYIALTRALDNLIVVDLGNAEFCEDDVISGEAPAEAADEAAPEMDIRPMGYENTATAEDAAAAAEEGEEDPFGDFDFS